MRNIIQGLIEKSNQLYDELLEQEIIPMIERENEDELSVEERKALRRERKMPKQARKQFVDFGRRKQKYEKDFEIFGMRNSYSKTDQDATFMRMKDDYMMNGQLKAGYNIQIATEGQFVLAYNVFPNPTDMRTLIPFLDKIEEDYFDSPKHIVADAGYGSEQNYNDIISNRDREALITYNMYQKEQKKKYKQDEFNTANWPYNEQGDFYICPNHQRLTYQI